MLYYLFFDDAVFAGRLDQMRICESSGEEIHSQMYRGPFATKSEAIKSAHMLMWIVVGRNYERLLTEKTVPLTTVRVNLKRDVPELDVPVS
jgi:hypothetical protein